MDRQQVEAVITELEGQGVKPTYEAILQRIGGGSRRDLSAILAQLRAEESGSVATMAAPTAVERFQEATALYDVTYARHSELYVKDKASGGLSDDETLEQMLLERRLAGMLPRLEALKAEVAQEQVLVDIDAIEAQWDNLRERKAEAYVEFEACVSDMRAAFRHILTIHDVQYGLSQKAPRDVQDRWSFPDSGTLAHWITSRFPVGQHWQQILLSNMGLTPLNLKEIMDVDGGTKPLPRILTDLRKKESA